MEYITREKLRQCLHAMAALDIILLPEEEDWLRLVHACTIPKGRIYVIDNGSGDTLTVFFTESGTLIKGFDHENELNQFAADEWDDTFFEYMFADMPDDLMALMNKDERDNTTFCMWCTDGSNQWIQNEAPENSGGRGYLLQYICQTAQQWCEWAEDYYDISLDVDAVDEIYKGSPVTGAIIEAINPERDVEDALQEIALLP